jgi:hypothetical protein
MPVDKRPLAVGALARAITRAFARAIRCVVLCAVALALFTPAPTPGAPGTPAAPAAPPPAQGTASSVPEAATPAQAAAGPLAVAPGALLSMSPPPVAPSACLTTGDGYLHAHLAGAIEENVDWPNSGTRCEGESRNKPPGVRLSFQRAHAGKTDLLFVFGITGVHEGKPTREAGVNLTIIVQGTSRIYGTLGDTRCTADSLKQKPLNKPGLYRVEARGFCTQPAHAVRGDGEVLVSTFEFAGSVAYDPPAN